LKLECEINTKNYFCININDIKKLNLKNEVEYFEEYDYFKDLMKLIIELKNDIMRLI